MEKLRQAVGRTLWLLVTWGRWRFVVQKVLESVGPKEKKGQMEVVVSGRQLWILGDLNGRKEEGERKALKAARENDQVSYKGCPILWTHDYLTEAFKTTKVVKDVFKIVKDYNCQLSVIPSKTTHDKNRLKDFVITKIIYRGYKVNTSVLKKDKLA